MEIVFITNCARKMKFPHKNETKPISLNLPKMDQTPKMGQTPY